MLAVLGLVAPVLARAVLVAERLAVLWRRERRRVNVHTLEPHHALVARQVVVRNRHHGREAAAPVGAAEVFAMLHAVDVRRRRRRKRPGSSEDYVVGGAREDGVRAELEAHDAGERGECRADDGVAIVTHEQIVGFKDVIVEPGEPGAVVNAHAAPSVGCRGDDDVGKGDEHALVCEAGDSNARPIDPTAALMARSCVCFVPREPAKENSEQSCHLRMGAVGGAGKPLAHRAPPSRCRWCRSRLLSPRSGRCIACPIHCE